MSKGLIFTGQPIFSQILSFIDFDIIRKATRQYKSDRYYKKFKTREHLITMLYCVLHKCTSIREVTTGMQVCYTKLNHLGMRYCPRKSTLSDANKSRNYLVFETIHQQLYKSLRRSLPDSQIKNGWFKRLYIVDSSTISLFKAILKTGGRPAMSGRKKGGIKVHAMIKADEDVPCFVRLTAAASHDVKFIQGLHLPAGSVITFDKGYFDYKQYDLWTAQKVNWVTRLKHTGAYTVIKNKRVSSQNKEKGVLSDQIIELGYRQRPSNHQTKARLIIFNDKDTKKQFKFISNNLKFDAFTIASIYQQRWQIELLFKRIKQNFPLQYFIGDNENAIKIQIYVALIADLLIKYLKTRLKRSWSFSNLTSMLRIHLMSYVEIIKFLNNPEKALINIANIQPRGPTLFE